MADQEDLAVGDDVTFDMPAGERTYVVGGIFEDNPVGVSPVKTRPR